MARSPAKLRASAIGASWTNSIASKRRERTERRRRQCDVYGENRAACRRRGKLRTHSPRRQPRVIADACREEAAYAVSLATRAVLGVLAQTGPTGKSSTH